MSLSRREFLKKAAIGGAVMALVGGCLGQSGAPWSMPATVDTNTSAPALPPAPEPGHLAPDSAPPDMAGDKLRLRGLRGQVVLVNSWATW